MTESDASLPAPVERALESHDAFESRDDDEDESAYRLTTTVFDTTVTATTADDPRDGTVHVTVTMPTLDAAVANEPVADVVEDGWFETLERRLEDLFDVARTTTHEEPTLERTDREVRVGLEYVAWDATEGIDDAKVLIEYVEGTYAQGIIPGYDYRGPAGELLENATGQGQDQNQGSTDDRNGNVPL